VSLRAMPAARALAPGTVAQTSPGIGDASKTGSWLIEAPGPLSRQGDAAPAVGLRPTICDALSGCGDLLDRIARVTGTMALDLSEIP
jgi:hypothetical protein